jgi:hypothetical protein
MIFYFSFYHLKVKVKRTYIPVFLRVYNMISTKTKTKTKTKNTILTALISTTFILSVFSYAMPTIQSQQAYGQGAFQTEPDQPPLIMDEANNETDQAEATTTTTTTDNNQKIILGGITIPINSNTTLSLEMPDSKITVEPNR